MSSPTVAAHAPLPDAQPALCRGRSLRLRALRADDRARIEALLAQTAPDDASFPRGPVPPQWSAGATA